MPEGLPSDPRPLIECRYLDKVFAMLRPWAERVTTGYAPREDLADIVAGLQPEAIGRCASDPLGTADRAARGVDTAVRTLAPPAVAVMRVPGLDRPEEFAARLSSLPAITPESAASLHGELAPIFKRWWRGGRFGNYGHSSASVDALWALEALAHGEFERAAWWSTSIAISHAGWGRTYRATWAGADRLIRAALGHRLPGRFLLERAPEPEAETRRARR